MMSNSRVTLQAVGCALLSLISYFLQGCGGGGSGSSPAPHDDIGDGDYPGHGISKSTYSCNDPVAAWNWLNKYFPVDTPTDECENNICSCPASGNTQAWEIQQGRVYTKRKGASGSGGHAGNGFGLHCVNVSEHLTTGGKSTREVEAQFTMKLGDMSKFDAFMDYNVVFYTEGLAEYRRKFKADGAAVFEGQWASPDGSSYDSIIIQVPRTQMILELVQESTSTSKEDKLKVSPLEQRVPTSLLAFAKNISEPENVPSNTTSSAATSSASGYIVPLVVNRAVSSTAMAKLDDFYISGMGTTKTHDEQQNGVAKKCYLWPGATVHICFTQRPDTATKGTWKVADFENMLNTVHKNLMDGHPFCGMDKWEDNHYAIDSQKADTSKIINYINSKKPYHYCESTGKGKGKGKQLGSSSPNVFRGNSASLHYVWDPTGWGIQLDMPFSSAPDDCKSMPSTGRRLQASHTNPACVLEPQLCGTPDATPALGVV